MNYLWKISNLEKVDLFKLNLTIKELVTKLSFGFIGFSDSLGYDV